METIFVKTHKYERRLLEFDEWRLVSLQQKIPTSFIWIIISFDEAFKYGDAAKFWSYITTNAKVIFVEFCSFESCHILVNYLTFSLSAACVSPNSIKQIIL
jgi:hypothetical protein